MVFRSVQGVQNSWRRLDGRSQLAIPIQGAMLADGIEAARQYDQAVAA
jgi:hypothetical protein